MKLYLINGPLESELDDLEEVVAGPVENELDPLEHESNLENLNEGKMDPKSKEHNWKTL